MRLVMKTDEVATPISCVMYIIHNEMLLQKKELYMLKDT